MTNVKVENMISSKGKKIANQFLIYADSGVYFQSYNTVIAYKPHNGKIQLDHNWDYSQTTGKYRNIFLREDKKTTEQKIKTSVYLLTNLN